MPGLKHILVRRLLAESGLVAPPDLEACLAEAAHGPGRSLLDLLVERGHLTPEKVTRFTRLRAQTFAVCEACRIAHRVEAMPDDAPGFPCCGKVPGDPGAVPLKDRLGLVGVGTYAPGAPATPVPASPPGTRKDSGPVRWPATPEAPDPLIGGAMGAVEILSVIGRGGMGTVYRGRRPDGGDVAVKVLSPDAARSRAMAVERFLREAEILLALRHPNIVRVDDIGEQKGFRYIVMEYLPGPALDAIARDRKAFALPRAEDLMEGILRGLAAAHGRGIIHRDIKPENILLGADGAPKITDFGLARGISRDSALTQTGEILGTPFWMSPEQGESDGRPLDARSDIYSLGATFYFLLTGELPFRGNTALEVILKHRTEVPPSPTSLDPHIPGALSQIVMKMIEKHPDRRYQAIEEVIADLAAVRRGESPDVLKTLRLRCVCGADLEFLETEGGKMRTCHRCARSVWVPRTAGEVGGTPPAPGGSSADEEADSGAAEGEATKGPGSGRPHRRKPDPERARGGARRSPAAAGEPRPPRASEPPASVGESAIDFLLQSGAGASSPPGTHALPRPAELYYARVAVKNGMVDPEDVLAIIRQRREGDVRTTLIEDLVTAGVLSSENVHAILKQKAHRYREKEDTVFARIAASAELVPRSDLVGAREEAKRDGTRLGELLVRRGLLTAADRDRVDAARRRYRRDCESALVSQIAVQKNLIGKDQAETLVEEIKRTPYDPSAPPETFIDLATSRGLLSPEEVEPLLDALCRYLLRRPLPELPLPELGSP